MIVLVNYEQNKLLDELEQREDKFNREVEDGKRGFLVSFGNKLCLPFTLSITLVIVAYLI
jgi:hypothetical protein